VFDDVFADVGDEQSIEASLSTFSAHLKNQGEILRLATLDSLVLMDEVGSGTDPAEGAALGGAILETLTRRGAMTVATTHLGQLKLLATEVPGVVNASLQFDAALLAPTYRLIKGVPGRSYGISIARRLQLPEDVLQVAESRLPAGERDLALLLADVEAREAVLAERELEFDREGRRIQSRIATVSDREKKARDKERELERSSRVEARKYLLEARAEVERTIAAVKAAAAEARIDIDAIEARAREARRSVEEAAAGQQQALVAMDARAAKARGEGRTARNNASATGVIIKRDVRPFVAGDAVLVSTLGDKAGSIVEVRGSLARVLVGSLTLSVPVTTLTRTTAPPPPTVRVPIMGDIPEVEPVREVDLRGMRVDELEIGLMQALDAAVRNDLREMRIIHGKGTGALRERVGEMLRGDSRVASHRLGAWNEGGAGVTVAELR
jgi:DNA mismatch repair protein MutS2